MHKILALVFSFCLYSADGLDKGPYFDPFSGTNYEKVFNPERLRQFIDVLDYDGSIENLPPAYRSDWKNETSEQVAINMLDEEGYLKGKSLIATTYKKSLKKEKYYSALTPLYTSAIDMGVKLACAIVILKTVQGDSIGITSIITTLGIICWSDLGRIMASYFKPANDPYAKHEVEFAEKMPYIPYQLWPRVTEVFQQARMGRIGTGKAKQFFDIAFNLPSLYQYPYHPPLKEEELNDKVDQINDFTRQFFSNHENGEKAQYPIQLAIRKYLETLCKNEDGIISIHLQGPSGIGKNHFVKAIASQISQVLGYDFPVQEINIRSKDPDELEGNRNIPGAVLTAISRICKDGKPYGMLVFDEASWLNKELRTTAKKMFNPDIGYFRSRYFDGYEVPLRGFLHVFMSNTPEDDKSGSCKIMNVQFPHLKRPSIEAIALENLAKHLHGTDLTCNDIIGLPEIKEAIENSNTIADIKKNLPIEVEKIRDRRRSLSTSVSGPFFKSLELDSFSSSQDETTSMVKVSSKDIFIR